MRLADGSAPLLEVENLRVEFRAAEGVLSAVRGISYTLEQGECLAIVGESGSGKTVSAQAVLGLLDRPPAFITGGAARFRGQDLLALPERELRKVRGRRIALVPQDALSSLNPVFPVGRQIGDMYRTHRGLSRSDAWKQAVRMMERVHIPNAVRRANAYPHELSGGMRQRVMIAMAVALGPEVLIADEPTTALDVTIQAQIIRLLAELRDETDLGLILITHDLSVVAEVADRVAVMYAGRIVESAPVRDLYRRPAHPYTVGLLASIPRVDRGGGKLIAVDGSPPDLRFIPSGCSFHPRCSEARPVCSDHEPPVASPAVGRTSACHFAEAVLDEQR